MSSIYCRSVLIETSYLSDRCLSLIGKSLSETLRLAISRATERPTLTHLIAYLVDIRTTQLSQLLAIRSKEFEGQCLTKLSQLKSTNNGSNVRNGVDQHIGQNIVELLKQISETVNKSNDLTKTELTYISGRSLDEVTDDFMYAFRGQRIDSSFLSQINILCIKTGANKEETDPLVCCQTSGNTSDNFDEFESLLETQTLAESEYLIDGYFKVWLHELNIIGERVRIYLNRNIGQNGTEQNKTEQTVVIKCDLKEALIDLNRLVVDRNSIQLNSTQTQGLESLANICDTNGCYELVLLGLISRLGLSDSVIYGIPYILSATRSPELSFDELELNSQRFYGLIEVMNEKNAAILLELKQQNNYLKTFVVLMSSPDTNTLVMKTIATKELVLPTFTDSLDTIISKRTTTSVVNSVRNQLNGFPFADVFNPLLFRNNLFNSL